MSEWIVAGAGGERMGKVKFKAPKGYSEATAYLRVGDAAEAIAFYTAAFGAKERFRLMMRDRVGHAELMFGESCVMLSSEFPEMGVVGPKALGGTSVSMMLYVADVDDVIARAVAAGAVLKRPVTDEFYGDRAGQVEDPFGHVWMIQTHIEDVSPKKMQKRLDEMMTGAAQDKSKPKKPARGRKTP